MTPVPYLFFPGTCEDALATYARIFDAPPPELMRVSDAPIAGDMPADAQNKIMHGAVRIGDGWIYASDDISGDTAEMAGSSVMVSLPDVARARAVFDALSEGGTVRMPFEKTFWTEGFGAFIDRFGIRWMVGTDAPPEAGAGETATYG
jgi:PhnB protein